MEAQKPPAAPNGTVIDDAELSDPEMVPVPLKPEDPAAPAKAVSPPAPRGPPRPVGPGASHHHRNTSEAAAATRVLAGAATLGSRWNALNWTWGFLFTMLVPAVGSIVWYGCIPVSGPFDPDKSDRARFVFLIHPFSMTFLAYLLVALFHTSVDPERPRQPVVHYLHILAVNWVVQMCFPGLYILFEGSFKLMALPALALVFIVTLVLLRLQPRKWIPDEEAYWIAFNVFRKVCITMGVYMCILAGYMIANAEVTGSGQGFLTFTLAIIGFIFKKMLLAFTDPIWLESAMLIAGFWLENLTDVFIVLAFPTANEIGATFALIFAARLAENLAYLGFQFDAWFKFRLWIKGKFKEDQRVAIEEDLPEHEDDRGHSAHHPGYRRRQLRFLFMKIFSQISSFVYFLALAPVLRWGPNKRRFPFSERIGGTEAEPDPVLLNNTWLDNRLQFTTQDRLERAMAFAAAQIVSSLLSGAGIWWFMHHYHPNIIRSLRAKYNAVVVDLTHYGLVLSILLANGLVGTSFVQIYYRVYWV